MVIEEEFTSKQQETVDIPTVPRPDNGQGTPRLYPKCLLPPEKIPADKSKRPTTTEPSRKWKHTKDSRTRVLTAQGKPVLSSDIRLHLEKL